MRIDSPLVSVIIPCFNYGRYLRDAIGSVISQGCAKTEIVVVDDGSTDETRRIAEEYEGVTYIYQANQGLSAARNTGLRNSKSSFLVFLDADDWLLPEAISTNLSFLLRNETLAFVSGGHQKVNVENGEILDVVQEIRSDHYYHLLHGNYIGMHGAVMFRRWAFDKFLYDPDLAACEDYDIYLNIARHFPVKHHSSMIAAYRIHSESMSTNAPSVMLSTALRVLNKQKKFLQSKKEKRALKTGKQLWREYYYFEIYNELGFRKQFPISEKIVRSILKCPRLGYVRYRVSRRSLLAKVKLFIKNNAPEFLLR